MIDTMETTVPGFGIIRHGVAFYNDLLAAKQAALAEEAVGIAAVRGVFSLSAVRKMRKTQLAALIAWDWEIQTALDSLPVVERVRIKPEGMTRSLFPKAKRVRLTRDNGGQSRKARREFTKNIHRKHRGWKRLELAQSA